MTAEKRRYFRINETIGLSFERLDKGEASEANAGVDIWDLMSEQDEKIENLLSEVSQTSPQIADLIRAVNQKLERIVGQVVMESRMIDRLANRVKEVNISACGVGFVCDEAIDAGARLLMEFQLFPGAVKVQAKGRVVACEELANGFYWRIDFYEIKTAEQELLIQHIVQRQSVQLKARRD